MLNATSDRKVNRSELGKYIPAAAGAAGTVLLASQPVSAQDATPIGEMSTQIGEVSGVIDVITPMAVGAIVFAVGALIVKRFAFA